MYNKFYGLKDKPFEITPDPRYLYLSESHREALAHLTYALNESKGFTVITGEVGTGKTTLVQMLLSRLDSHTRIAHLFNPKLGTRDFFKYICQDFGLKTDGFSTKGEFLSLLHTFLMECYARRERVVLIVDEAQTLSPALLEEVRLITNLETPKAKLLQVILLGQPELDKTLAMEFRAEPAFVMPFAPGDNGLIHQVKTENGGMTAVTGRQCLPEKGLCLPALCFWQSVIPDRDISTVVAGQTDKVDALRYAYPPYHWLIQPGC